MQYILLFPPLVLKKLIYITVFTAFLDRKEHVYIQKICQEREIMAHIFKDKKQCSVNFPTTLIKAKFVKNTRKKWGNS